VLAVQSDFISAVLSVRGSWNDILENLQGTYQTESKDKIHGCICRGGNRTRLLFG
ncbi:Hypothetical predicted protein, partial [Paramuricea clavata]